MEREKTENSENTLNTSATLPELFLTFAKVGVMTFGGGMAMLPMLQREIIDNKHWADDEEIADYFAIGQCTPGIIAVNTATFIGYKMRGIPGGIAATLGVTFPSVVIITLLAGVISRFQDNIYVKKAFLGIRACVCVLILNAVIKLWKSAVKDKLTLTMFLAVLFCTVCLDLSPVLMVACAVAFGVIFEIVASRRNGAEKEAEK
ncbi:MAG: chromate transporter [Anaerovoracaceae bacterium]